MRPDEGVETTRTAGAVRLRHAVGGSRRPPTTWWPGRRRSSPRLADATSRSPWPSPPATARALAAVPPADGLPGGATAPTVPLSLPDGRTIRARPSPPGGPESCARSAGAGAGSP